MTVWIQRHDYSSDTFEVASADEAESLFRTFDWKSEIQREDEAQAAGIDCCPPGMGLVGDVEDILHIMPGPDGRAVMVYMHAQEATVLGFLKWKRNKHLSVSGFPTSRVPPLMRLHFVGGRQSEIVAMLETEGHR